MAALMPFHAKRKLWDCLTMTAVTVKVGDQAFTVRVKFTSLGVGPG